jgi:hypothetical protein
MSYTTQLGNATPTGQRVRNAVAVAAERTGVGFDYLYNQAKIESGLRPDAKASTSSAAGLFQFTQQTWLATVKTQGATHGLNWAADAISKASDGSYRVANPALRSAVLDLRFQPEAASAMAAEFASDNNDLLSASLGRAPESVDLYLAHFLGSAGAVSFLTTHANNPDAAAAPLFPAAAAANRPIFYTHDGRARSFEEIRAHFAGKIGDAVPPHIPSVSPFGAMPESLAPFAQLSVMPNLSKTQDDQRAPLQLRALEPMPRGLSLEFAQRAYQRLAEMGRGPSA